MLAEGVSEAVDGRFFRAARPGRGPLFAVFQGSHLTRLTDAQSLLNKLAEAREET